MGQRQGHFLSSAVLRRARPALRSSHTSVAGSPCSHHECGMRPSCWPIRCPNSWRISGQAGSQSLRGSGCLLDTLSTNTLKSLLTFCLVPFARHAERSRAAVCHIALQERVPGKVDAPSRRRHKIRPRRAFHGPLQKRRKMPATLTEPLMSNTCRVTHALGPCQHDARASRFISPFFAICRGGAILAESHSNLCKFGRDRPNVGQFGAS